MEQQSEEFRIRQRREMLLKSVEFSKQLTPQERFAAFVDLQEAMVETYFQGLQARFPNLSSDKLLEIAKKERMKHISK